MPFWDDARIEPKRAYRFLVPFRVFLPATAAPTNPVAISEWARCGHDLIDTQRSKYGRNNVFWFLAQSVTKPGISTSLSRTEHVVNGYSPQRRNQPLAWNFEPISLQLIDTYDHDIEMSITAQLFALGGIQQPGVGVWASHYSERNFAGSMVPLDNGVPGEFAIYELLDGHYGAQGKVSSLRGLNSPRMTPGQLLNPSPDATSLTPDQQAERQRMTTQWARKIVLKNPYLVSADFGSLDYNSNAFSTVSLQIDYDAYDIVHMVDRHNFDPSDFSSRTLGQLRQNQRDSRRHHRERLTHRGATPGERASHMNSVRREQRLDRRALREETRSGNVEAGRTVD